MSAPGRTLRWAVVAAISAVVATLVDGCVDDLAEPLAQSTAPLEVGESREVELRYLRFDVQGFAKRYSKAELAKLPKDITRRLWLFDLDLRGGPSAPRLLDNSLSAIAALDPAELPPAARNMRALTTMTPATADLSGTSLAPLLDIAPLLGLAPPKVLSDMLQRDVDAPFLSRELLADALYEDVIATHPNARTRLGTRRPDNPDGVYPVTPGTLPVMLSDAATDFATMADTFGEYDKNGEYHPGFIVGESHAEVLSDDFAMVVRANANALPFKGLDLGIAGEASVNSTPSQLDRLFDFGDPDWLRFEGLAPGAPAIQTLTFRVTEAPGFVAGGTSPLPAGRGDSAAWALPPWSFEHLVVDAARRAFVDVDSTTRYYLPNHDEPVFDAEVADGWQSIDVTANLGSPPAPSYLWDALLEVAQARLHDGGLAEGAATVELTLHDVSVGVDSETIAQRIKANLEADPAALADIASAITDNTVGAADVYYVRAPEGGDLGAGDQDWLFFVAAGDIPRDDDGVLLRDYARYDKIGFFADAALTDKISRADVVVDFDGHHEKIAVAPGDRVYVGDDDGKVFAIDVGAKPSVAHLALTLTRVR